MNKQQATSWLGMAAAGVSAVALAVILAVAFTGARASTQDESPQWTQGYDVGHVQGACVALTGATGCDWSQLAVCQPEAVAAPCTLPPVNGIRVVYLGHTCPWLPDGVVCAEVTR